MMTPPLSISASPVLRRRLVELPLFCDMSFAPLSTVSLHGSPALDLPKGPFTLFYPYHFLSLALGRWWLATNPGPRRAVNPAKFVQRPRTNDRPHAQTGHISPLEPLRPAVGNTSVSLVL